MKYKLKVVSVPMAMKKNIGVGDMIVRGVLGLFLVWVAAANYPSGLVVSAISFVLGLYLIITSMLRKCFFY